MAKRTQSEKILRKTKENCMPFSSGAKKQKFKKVKMRKMKKARVG